MAAKLKAKPASSDVIARAEALLADVKSGKIKGFAAAYVLADDPLTGSMSGIATGDILTARLLTTAIHEMGHEFAHAIRGR